ncbi:hypothetical protein, variant [Sphaeroforma arctica JP610]|uniref:Uncharacterized protein n=1 Tax=Sphaeroforma arctica JP610 TaxID=667725 RepID=A0A0L0G1C6_9EUKA|nr:hypothetical protein, variant [Sphaeroforma arctica JP610]KNC82957.1 hypothetical protein, variant [Sphaeroforma arctica JP610]|eukprot:XP_014156859.1 hypothetical protein, variant [Sphaeroforma arctica JP610]
MQFNQDPIARGLANGNPEDGVWGLVVVALNPFPEVAREPYEAFARQINDIDKNNAVYVYPFSALHCTVATITAFHPTVGYLSSGAVNENNKEEVIQKRNDLMHASRVIFDRVMEPLKTETKHDTYKYTFGKPTISPNAGIMFLDESADEITLVRKRLAVEFGIAEGSTMAPELQECDYPTDNYIQPNIKHTSFLRYVGDPDAEFEANFKRLADKHWHDVTWTCDQAMTFTLANELVPYMHISDVHRLHRRQFGT